MEGFSDSGDVLCFNIFIGHDADIGLNICLFDTDCILYS